MEITGKDLLADFGRSKAILYFKNEKELQFTITEKDGVPVNIVETVAVTIKELGRQLYMVSWREKSGTTVTQVQDMGQGILYANWTTPGGDFISQQGKLLQLSTIMVQTTVKASLADCWRSWTNPAEIVQFNNPGSDWHTTSVTCDLQNGGHFFYRMEATDGSAGFDFSGRYDMVIPNERIAATGDDGRKTINTFMTNGSSTLVTEIFEPESTTPLNIQRNFCQGILDSFKAYMESGKQ